MKIRTQLTALAAALALLGGCSDNEYGEHEDGVPSPGEGAPAVVEQDIGESPIEEPGVGEGEEEFGSAVEGVMGEDVEALEKDEQEGPVR